MHKLLCPCRVHLNAFNFVVAQKPAQKVNFISIKSRNILCLDEPTADIRCLQELS